MIAKTEAMTRRTSALFRADLVKFLGKPKTKNQILNRFFLTKYGRGEDRVAVMCSRVIERQLAAALTSRLVRREGGRRYARYVASVGAASAARMEAALETRRERNERRLAKGKRS